MNSVERLFGGKRSKSLGQLVARAEGIEPEEMPEYALSEASKRQVHMSAALKELTPYHNGSVGIVDRLSALIREARTYRLICLVLAAACVVMTIGVVRMALDLAHTRVVPYVVQVDKHGFTVPVGHAERDTLQSPRQVMAAIGRWVTSFRTITGEQRLQEGLVQQAFFFVAPKSVGAQKMHEIYEKRPVFDGTGKRVVVEISRIAPMQNGSDFTVDWSEETSDVAGENVVKNLYTAVVTVAVSPTEELDHILVNPSGVFIKNFGITKLQ